MFTVVSYVGSRTEIGVLNPQTKLPRSFYTSSKLYTRLEGRGSVALVLRIRVVWVCGMACTVVNGPAAIGTEPRVCDGSETYRNNFSDFDIL